MADLTAKQKKELRKVHLGIQNKEGPQDIYAPSGSQEERMPFDTDLAKFAPAAPIRDESEPKIFGQQRALLKGKGVDVGSEGTAPTKGVAAGLSERKNLATTPQDIDSTINAMPTSSDIGKATPKLGSYWKNLGSTPETLGPIATRAKRNMMEKDPRFGPNTSVGGRDVYEMKDGERTGSILESSEWLKGGNAFSSNAWQKTVGGQPNQGYDPNAVQPAGYYNEAGTFIAGPRIKEWEVGTLITHATAGIKDPELRKSIADGIMKQAGVVTEDPGGAEKERGLKERIARINAEASKATASITASADNYRSDTPYYQEDRSTPSTPAKQQVVQIGEEPTDTGGTRKIWGTPDQAVSGSGRGNAVSNDRVRVIQNQLRDLKGKDRENYIDNLTPEEFDAVKGSR